MSEADGIDDAVEGGLRQTLTVATQIAERVARARQEALRKREAEDDRAAQETARQIAAERTAMRAAIAPVQHDQWWDQANSAQVTEAYQAAEAWKDHDPDALAASSKIHEQVQRRYGINTHDLEGDGLYLQSAMQTQQAAHERREAAREHHQSMALIAAAQAEEARSRAAAVRPEIERHQIPEDYLASPELLQALESAQKAAGTEERSIADRKVTERVHLISKDGLNGPSIDQLRQELEENYSGTHEDLFRDSGFVQTAKDWHEARTLAEGGFDQTDPGLEARYENSEKELFNHIGQMGREIESRVLNEESRSLAGQAEQSDRTAAAAYGSADHRNAFAASLKDSANSEHVAGRVLAATDQGKHPREAVKSSSKAPKARKTPTGAGVSKEQSKGGPTR